jgi:hypothetical protein
MNQFSLVISWRDRPELAETMRANAALFTKYCQEIVIVNVGGDPEHLSRLIRDQPLTNVRQVHMPGVPEFNWPLACNIGTLCSAGPYLCFLDGDIIVKTDIFGAAARLLQRRKCFVKVRSVHETDPVQEDPWPGVEEIATTHVMHFKNGKKASLKLFTGGGKRCGSGLLLLKRDHVLGVGGFNALQSGWGFHDVDFHFRLQFVLGLSVAATGAVLHLSHPDARRVLNTGATHTDYQRNRMMALANYQRGDYAGTYQADVKTWGGRIRQLAPA